MLDAQNVAVSRTKLLLTERETCEMVGLSRSTLRRLWADGAIRPVKIGRSLRFPLQEIERFVQSLQAEAGVSDGGYR